MAGCPIKRARRAAVREAGDGRNIVVLRRLDHPRAGLSHAAWRGLSPAERLERLFDISLDDMAEILSWPVAELDPAQLNGVVTIARVVLMVGAKAGFSRKRSTSATGSASSKTSRGGNSATRHRIGTGKRRAHATGLQESPGLVCGATSARARAFLPSPTGIRYSVEFP
jgi:hypothetical protein